MSETTTHDDGSNGQPSERIADADATARERGDLAHASARFEPWLDMTLLGPQTTKESVDVEVRPSAEGAAEIGLSVGTTVGDSDGTLDALARLDADQAAAIAAALDELAERAREGEQ